MNTLDRLYRDSKNTQGYIEGYFAHLSKLLKTVDLNAIAESVDLILNARKTSNQILFIGNGGSAATASHFANDIAIGTRTTDRPFKALALTDNVAAITALANDEGYNEIFIKQLEVLMNPGDVVFALSASGNSPNIIKAVEYAKSKGNKVVGLSGFDGGKLKALSDVKLHVETEKGEYGPVEDFHMILDHVIGTYLYRVVHQS